MLLYNVKPEIKKCKTLSKRSAEKQNFCLTIYGMSLYNTGCVTV